VQFAHSGGDLGAITEPLAVDPRGREVPLHQVGCAAASFPRPGRAPAPPPGPGRQVLPRHQRGDSVLADTPARIAQVGGDPRRAVLALMQREQASHLGSEPLPAGSPRR